MKTGKNKGDKKDVVKKTNRKRHEKRDLAGLMFVSADMDAKEISEALGISEPTLSKWRGEDNWDERRDTMKVTPLELIKRFNRQIVLILDKKDPDGNERELSNADTDKIAKFTKSIANLSNKLTPQTIMEVLYAHATWLANRDLDTAQKVAKYNMEYLELKLKESKER